MHKNVKAKDIVKHCALDFNRVSHKMFCCVVMIIDTLKFLKALQNVVSVYFVQRFVEHQQDQ